MWESIRQSAEIEWLRNDAERRLQQLDAADLIDSVQRRIDAAAPRTGRITDWRGLLQAGVLAAVPVDRSGMPLTIDDTGRVQLSPASPLYPLPVEPRHAA